MEKAEKLLPLIEVDFLFFESLRVGGGRFRSVAQDYQCHRFDVFGQIEVFFEARDARLFGGDAAPAGVQPELLCAQQKVLGGGGAVVLVVAAFGDFELRVEVAADDYRRSRVFERLAVRVDFHYVGDGFFVVGNDEFPRFFAHCRGCVHRRVEYVEDLLPACAARVVVCAHRAAGENCAVFVHQ